MRVSKEVRRESGKMWKSFIKGLKEEQRRKRGHFPTKYWGNWWCIKGVVVMGFCVN